MPEPGQPPLVVAHRGASASVAEHTLDAYLAAIEEGADGLECDVRLTADGHLVCVHDRTVNRTSSGTGVVSEFTLGELNSLDFTSWHGRRSATRVVDDEEVPDRAGTGVLTLAMLCELVHDAGRPIRLFVETKHPNRYAGLVEKELVELLRYFGWAGQPGPATGLRRRAAPETTPVLVMSFAPIALRRVRLLAPDVSTVLLRNRSHPGWLLPPGVRVAGPSLKGLRADPDFVDRLHRYHRQVYVWTVDEPEDVDFVVGLGVDMIATNRPGDVAKRVHA